MGEKIKGDFEKLKQQTMFLFEKHKEMQRFYNDQFGELISFINKKIDGLSSKEGEKENLAKFQSIYDIVTEQSQKFLVDIDEDISFLKEQLKAIENIEKSEDLQKKKELVELMLDGEKLLDTDQFKKEVAKEGEESINDFKMVVGDLEGAIEEGNLDEVILYLQEMAESEKRGGISEEEEF